MSTLRCKWFTKTTGVLVVSAVALTLASGCTRVPDETIYPSLPSTLFHSVLDVDRKDDVGNIAVNGIYQDVQRTIDPNSNIPVGDMSSWVVVSICGDSTENGPNLHQIQAAIIPASMLTPAVERRAEAGEFLPALECQPTWIVVPTLPKG